jgi:hypothetical protein
MFILPIIHALLFATYSWALGINCRGTTDCTTIRNSAKAQGFFPANEINKSIQSMSDEAFYSDQHPIGARFQAVMMFWLTFPSACCSTDVLTNIYLNTYVSAKICAYLLNTHGAFGMAIKTFSGQIVDHGCEACGSVSLFFRNQHKHFS